LISQSRGLGDVYKRQSIDNLINNRFVLIGKGKKNNYILIIAD
jgi:hypothetical protein